MKFTLLDLYHQSESKYQSTKLSADKKSLKRIESYCNRWGAHVGISDQDTTLKYNARIVANRTGDSVSHCEEVMRLFLKIYKNELKRLEKLK